MKYQTCSLTCDKQLQSLLVYTHHYSICRMLSVFELSDNDVVTIYPIGRDFIATSESNIIFSFDDETLETKDRVSGLDSVKCQIVSIH